jgi:hypothetical protein
MPRISCRCSRRSPPSDTLRTSPAQPRLNTMLFRYKTGGRGESRCGGLHGALSSSFVRICGVNVSENRRSGRWRSSARSQSHAGRDGGDTANYQDAPAGLSAPVVEYHRYAVAYGRVGFSPAHGFEHCPAEGECARKLDTGRRGSAMKNPSIKNAHGSPVRLWPTA